jgi:hypothetical protein
MVKTAAAVLAAGALVASVGWAELPITNGAGVSLVRESAESWSGDTQTNGAGVTVTLAGAGDASKDTPLNTAGARAYVGLIDPTEIRKNAAGVTWLMYEGGE